MRILLIQIVLLSLLTSMVHPYLVHELTYSEFRHNESMIMDDEGYIECHCEDGQVKENLMNLSLHSIYNHMENNSKEICFPELPGEICTLFENCISCSAMQEKCHPILVGYDCLRTTFTFSETIYTTLDANKPHKRYKRSTLEKEKYEVDEFEKHYDEFEKYYEEDQEVDEFEKYYRGDQEVDEFEKYYKGDQEVDEFEKYYEGDQEVEERYENIILTKHELKKSKVEKKEVKVSGVQNLIVQKREVASFGNEEAKKKSKIVHTVKAKDSNKEVSKNTDEEFKKQESVENESEKNESAKEESQKEVSAEKEYDKKESAKEELKEEGSIKKGPYKEKSPEKESKKERSTNKESEMKKSTNKQSKKEESTNKTSKKEESINEESVKEKFTKQDSKMKEFSNREYKREVSTNKEFKKEESTNEKSEKAGKKQLKEETPQEQWKSGWPKDKEVYCDYPLSGKTFDVLVARNSTFDTFAQLCTYGYTLRQGITRISYCNHEKKKFIPKYPVQFEECKPFVNCTVEFLRGGRATCSSGTWNKPPVCYVSCDYYEEGDNREGKHECDVDEGFIPKLPSCAVIGTNHGLVRAPIIKVHNNQTERILKLYGYFIRSHPRQQEEN